MDKRQRTLKNRWLNFLNKISIATPKYLWDICLFCIGLKLCANCWSWIAISMIITVIGDVNFNIKKWESLQYTIFIWVCTIYTIIICLGYQVDLTAQLKPLGDLARPYQLRPPTYCRVLTQWGIKLHTLMTTSKILHSPLSLEQLLGVLCVPYVQVNRAF